MTSTLLHRRCRVVPQGGVVDLYPSGILVDCGGGFDRFLSFSERWIARLVIIIIVPLQAAP